MTSRSLASNTMPSVWTNGGAGFFPVFQSMVFLYAHLSTITRSVQMPSENELTRRDFATVTTGALSVLGALGAGAPLAAQTGSTAGSAADEAPIDLAEWSFFWV